MQNGVYYIFALYKPGYSQLLVGTGREAEAGLCFFNRNGCYHFIDLLL